jgi:glycosyltransferase involved in cell wall biosynthesis
MKIAIDARMYGTEHGGIGRYIANLVRELQVVDRKNKYVLLLRKKYFDLLKNPNEKWEKILTDARHYSFKEQMEVSKALNNINPDLVHFPHFNIPVFYKGKYIVTIHDLLMHKRTGAGATTLPPVVYFVKRFGYKFVFGNAIRRAVKIIVPTDFVKQEVEKVYPDTSDKLEVIYEGVDGGLFKGVTGGGYLRRNKIKKPYFLYVGSVYPHKNVERAVEAAAFSQKTLVIVTPRSIFQKRLDSFVKKHDAKNFIKFTGYVDDRDLVTLYKNAAAFVYPSLEEGFGLPGLEAMANKCLVLASDIPVFKEVYKDNAIYFNPLDFSSIAKAIQEALEIKSGRREKLVNKAFEFSKKYNWNKTANETLRLYSSVYTDMSIAP